MACASNEIHLWDIGTIFEITIYEDCDTLLPGMENAIVKKVIFQRTDGTSFNVDAEFKTDGTDSIVQYTTVEGDLDQEGGWAIQAFIELPSGQWYSDIEYFEVIGNLMVIV